MADIKSALISVSDKTGVSDFAKRLQGLGIDILSTGGTAKLLKESGVNVTEVSDYTGFPEIMDGRVKTLHPKVHAGLLAVRDNPEHRAQLEKLNIETIDMVVVNLYPFEETIAKEGVTLEEAIENIDIGGPTMLRSAAKNYRHVAVVVDPDDYEPVAEALESSNGELSEDYLFNLALKAFRHTAGYDSAISKYLGRLKGEIFPPSLTLSFDKKQELRYGENPHQLAAFYVERDTKEPSISTAEQLSGKELSFNNIFDLNAAIEIVKEFDEPTVAVIKHANPCGAASANSLAAAFKNAYEGDPLSAFGCIVGANRIMDVATATEIASPDHFIEAIIAPDFENEAIEILTTRPKWGKSVRLLKTGELERCKIDESSYDVKRVVGGILLQGRDLETFDESTFRTVTEREPTQAELEDLKFAWVICKHVKSNAIVFAKDKSVIGVGAGQMSRVDSVIIAARKAGDRSKGTALASDAFFPKPDGVEEAACNGVTCVIQPGGSVGDEEVISMANRYNMAMVFTGQRHFRH